MAKRTTAESDETRLKKKVTAELTGHKGPDGDATLRALRKRLKRAQRKRRALASRKKRAAGRKPEAATPTA
jgi:hypothetical protein